MIVFFDTSAFYALSNATDSKHQEAVRAWESLSPDRDCRFVTTNYVAVEVATLLQRRRGMSAVRDFVDFMHANVEITYIEPAIHNLALAECLHENRRDVSLVDHVSFAFMQRHGIRAAFAFDEHFVERGFKLPSLR